MIVSNDVITQANQHIIISNELMGELSVSTTSTFPSTFPSFVVIFPPP